MSKRILVVEDQEDNRQIIRDLLSATDYEITEAESGEQALEAVAVQRPDLILMDIQLPEAPDPRRRRPPDRHLERAPSQADAHSVFADDRRRHHGRLLVS